MDWKRIIFGFATTDHQWNEMMRLTIDIDRADTDRALFFCNLIQTIEKRNNLLAHDPGLSNRTWDGVFVVQFLDEPVCQWETLDRPGGEIEDNGHGVVLIFTGTGKQRSGELKK